MSANEEIQIPAAHGDLILLREITDSSGVKMVRLTAHEDSSATVYLTRDQYVRLAAVLVDISMKNDDSENGGEGAW